MITQWKKWRNTLFIPTVVLLLGTAGLSSVFAVDQADSALHVQFVADQQSVGAGSAAFYHILYSNEGDAAVRQAELTMALPDGMTLEPSAGATLNEALHAYIWSVADLKPNTAGEIDVDVKVDASVAAGTKLPLVLTGLADGKAVVTSTQTLEIGPETHQPFFVGYPDGGFHPSANLSRAEAAAVVARIKQLKDDPDRKVAYSDVSATHWAYRYIRKVTEAGYMTGYDGKFRPDDPISRSELVSILLRIRGIDPVPLDSFPDVAGHWAQNIVGTAQALHYLDHYTGRFDPDLPIRRDEAAQLFCISLFRGPLADGDARVAQHFPDVALNDWAFGWVEETAKVTHESVRKDGRETLIRYLPDETDPM